MNERASERDGRLNDPMPSFTWRHGESCVRRSREGSQVEHCLCVATPSGRRRRRRCHHSFASSARQHLTDPRDLRALEPRSGDIMAHLNSVLAEPTGDDDAHQVSIGRRTLRSCDSIPSVAFAPIRAESGWWSKWPLFHQSLSPSFAARATQSQPARGCRAAPLGFAD